MDARRLDRALVTGASAGIGREIAVALARRGIDLVLVARGEDQLRTVAGELHEEHGVDVELLRADLLDAQDLAAVEGRLASSDMPIDLLVNNAGISRGGWFGKVPAADAEAVVRLNALVPTRLSRAAIPGMRERGRGAVMMMSSVASLHPLPTLATYAASKAFLTSLGRSLHEELRGSGVTCTVVRPGFTATAMTAKARLPGLVLSDTHDVAEAAVDAALAGEAVVTPGRLWRAHVALAALLPPAVLVRAVGLATRRR